MLKINVPGFANFIDEWSQCDFLESFWNIWIQVSDFPARGPGMYKLLWGKHEVTVAVRLPGKLKFMMAVIE